MRFTTRLVSVATMVVAAVWFAAPTAYAHDSHPVVVTPASGLRDGDTVTVSAPAGAFPAGTTLFLLQCSNDAAIPEDATGAAACSLTGPSQGYYSAIAAADGSVPPTDVVVHTGQLGSHQRSVCPPADPSVPDCGIIVTNLDTSHYGVGEIAFAAAAQTTTTGQATTTTSGSATTVPSAPGGDVPAGSPPATVASGQLAYTGPDVGIARWLAMGLVSLQAGFLLWTFARPHDARRRALRAPGR